MQTSSKDDPKIYDIIGIGFGPANIALAIGLHELWPDAKTLFLEKNDGPSWQSGMRMFGSDIQNHPLRDLVTPRNPQSFFTFTNFLHQHNRLFEHLNLGRSFPFRSEYEQYVQWTAGFFKEQTRYHCTVTRLERATNGLYHITTDKNQTFKTQSVIVAPGRTPFIPRVFEDCLSNRCVHLTDYITSIKNLFTRKNPRRIAVIGGSQSAVELLLDLSSRFPDAELHAFKRTFGFRMKDVSPFTGEVYFPSYVDTFFEASRPEKDSLINDLRLTNYSASDSDVLNQLYELIYQQKISNKRRIFIHRRAEINHTSNQQVTVRLEFKTLENKQSREMDFDLVLLATGFRDLGPQPHQESCPILLNAMQDQLHLDENNCVQINRDYSVRLKDQHDSSLFLNGLCENSHGMGDAGSFSLLSLRTQIIIDSLQKIISIHKKPEEKHYDTSASA